MNEGYINKNEKSSTSLVNSVTEALFSYKEQSFALHNPDKPKPYCDEEGLKLILKAIEAYTHTKIGDNIKYKEGITNQPLEQNFYMTAQTGQGHVDLREDEPKFRNDTATVLEFKVNVPQSMMRFMGSGAGALALLHEQAKKGHSDGVIAEEISRIVPIIVDNNCIGVIKERKEEFNPSPNPMFLMVFNAEFPEKLKDPEKLLDRISEIVQKNRGTLL